jgi:putative FmdB family regulatory protein
MPIFEYACQHCHQDFEILVRSHTVPQCPHCQSTALDKKLSVFATAAAGAEGMTMAAPAPCGSCGHPDGPGACAVH